MITIYFKMDIHVNIVVIFYVKMAMDFYTVSLPDVKISFVYIVIDPVLQK